MHWKKFRTKFAKVRHRKVEKAIMFALQRAKYFLSCNIDEDLLNTTSELQNGVLCVYSGHSHDIYHELFELDAEIRTTDDLIDEVICTKKTYLESEIFEAINNFSKNLPIANKVTELFVKEREVKRTKDSEQKRSLLLDIMKLRSSDIDLLIDTLIKKLSTSLSDQSLKNSLSLIRNWEFYDVVITDLWYFKQDVSKNSFNLFHFAKDNDLDFGFIVSELKNTILNMKKFRIVNHKYPNFIKKVIQNTENIYNKIYAPLINELERDEESWYQSLISIKLI